MVALYKLLGISLIDEVYLDTESDEVISKISSPNVLISRRESRYATNQTDGNQMMVNFIERIDGDIYVKLLCTSPFILSQTIERGIRFLLEHPEHDSIFAVRKEKCYLWQHDKPLYDINHIPNSKMLEDTIIEAMSLYIIRKEAVLKTKRRIGNTPYMLNITPLEALDINYPEDYEFALSIAKGIKYNV